MNGTKMIKVGLVVGALASGGAAAGIAGAAGAPAGQSTTSTQTTPSTTTPRPPAPPGSHPQSQGSGHPCPHMGGQGSHRGSGSPNSGSAYEGGPPPGAMYQ
jgi:hypothetical protein